MTHQTKKNLPAANAFPLAAERGAGLAEFLICAPIVALLAFGAYDLNKRLEDKETATMLARDAVFLGGGVGDAAQASAAKKMLETIGNFLDHGANADEASLVTRAATSAGASGVRIASENVNTDHIAERVAPVSGINVDSSYAFTADVTGNVGAAAVRIVNGFEAAGNTFGVLMDDPVHRVTVQTSVPGTANALQKTMGLIASAATRDEAASNAVVSVERRYAGQMYLRGESGYHPNRFHDFTVGGIVLGLTKSSWGSEGDFDDDAEGIQSRCMTRFYSNSACGGAGTSEQKGRKFFDQIRALADAKFTLSTILETVGQPFGGGAADQGISEGVKALAGELLEQGVQKLSDQLMKQLEEGLANQAQSFIDRQIADLTNGPGEIAGNLMPQIDPAPLAGRAATD